MGGSDTCAGVSCGKLPIYVVRTPLDSASVGAQKETNTVLYRTVLQVCDFRCISSFLMTSVRRLLLQVCDGSSTARMQVMRSLDQQADKGREIQQCFETCATEGSPPHFSGSRLKAASALFWQRVSAISMNLKVTHWENANTIQIQCG